MEQPGEARREAQSRTGGNHYAPGFLEDGLCNEPAFFILNEYSLILRKLDEAGPDSLTHHKAKARLNVTPADDGAPNVSIWHGFCYSPNKIQTSVLSQRAPTRCTAL